MRYAFTLTEMLVALAVTVVALAVVSSVFSVTTKTAAVSAAIADVQTLARNFADQVQRDLEYCDPSQSILVIHGRTQAAALTEEFQQGQQYYRVLTGDPGLVTSGYDPRFDSGGPGSSVDRDQFSDPRADILMFFTNRPTASKAPATGTNLPSGSFQEKLQRGAKVSPIQVVYGHAALDTAVRSGSTWAFADNLQHIERTDENESLLSPLPANRWHLSRRATLLEKPRVGFEPRRGFTTPRQQFERIVRCYSSDTREAGDSVQFDCERYLAEFQPLAPIDTRPRVALLSPYGFSPGAPVPPALQWTAFRQHIRNVLYLFGDEPYHHVATVIEQPPAALQDNLGVHLLPGCVWFQVEFLLPEDPRNGLDHPLSDQRRDTPRWVEVEHGQTYVFVPDTDENRQLVESRIYTSGQRVGMPLPNPNRLRSFMQVIPPNAPYNGPDLVSNRRVRMWPYAIRVTVRVFDKRGRLDEPIVRSVVHRFD